MFNFNNYSDQELIDLAIEQKLIDPDHKPDLLEIVELIAENECWCKFTNLISNEAILSKGFDHYLIEIGFTDFDDLPLFNETFNNWIDLLSKDGFLHSEQANNYCYIGKHSN